MKRPYVICHMLQSLDGMVTGDFLFRPECEAATDHYYRINRDFAADAYACGRVTMEGSFTGGWYPDLTPFQNIDVPREDHVADKTAKFFAVAFDRRGKLGWKGSRIADEDPGYGDAHIIEVLCQDAPDAYLAYLRHIGVSYLFAGERELDLSLALEKLRGLFGIRTLLLEGGSDINGAFARAGVIDELSLIQVPLTGGTEGKPLLGKSPIDVYALLEASPLEGGALWLRLKHTP